MSHEHWRKIINILYSLWHFPMQTMHGHWRLWAKGVASKKLCFYRDQSKHKTLELEFSTGFWISENPYLKKYVLKNTLTIENLNESRDEQQNTVAQNIIHFHHAFPYLPSSTDLLTFRAGWSESEEKCGFRVQLLSVRSIWLCWHSKICVIRLYYSWTAEETVRVYSFSRVNLFLTIS